MFGYTLTGYVRRVARSPPQFKSDLNRHGPRLRKSQARYRPEALSPARARGGTGRRAGLGIRWEPLVKDKPHVGSTPAVRTTGRLTFNSICKG